MEEQIFAEYPIDGKVYQLLQGQPFDWASKVKKADGNWKYPSGMKTYDKEVLKRCPDVVVELSVLNPELIRVKEEEVSSNRGLENPKKIKAEEQKGATA